MDEKPEINFILLKDRVHNDRNEIIEDYIEILSTCETRDDVISLLDQFYNEVMELTGEFIIEQQIRREAEVLEKLRGF